MHTKNKPNELEETPQKYVTTDRIKHLFHSISFLFIQFLINAFKIDKSWGR